MSVLLTSLIPGNSRFSSNALKLIFCTALFLIMVQTTSWAQSLHVITFEELIQHKAERRLSWINPDSSREEIEIIEIAIPIDQEMVDLTRKFQKENYGRASVWVDPAMIVIHSMDLGDLKSSLEQSSFLARSMPRRWKTQIKAGSAPSGAHFIIDGDGTIYCLTPPSALSVDLPDESNISYDRNAHHWFIRRHLDANPAALGIENITEKNGSYDDLTDQQVSANAKLVRWLLWMEKGSIRHIASHHQFNDRAQFVSMLNEFSILLARPMYRAWTRKDVGDVVFHKIYEDVTKRRWNVSDHFTAKED